jgi:hypothetical protein
MLQLEFVLVLRKIGARGGAVVEALRYKLKGRRIDSRWCQLDFFIDISFF